MSDVPSISWLNGEYIDENKCISRGDRGFLIGDGAFETMLIRKGVPVFLGQHLKRLAAGLSALHISSPVLEGIDTVFRELAHRNGLINDDASGRLTVTRGTAGRGLASAKAEATTILPTIFASVASTKSNQTKPLALHITERLRDERFFYSGFKAISGYAENQAARFEAEAAGADEGVMVNLDGRIACAATANIFIIDDNGTVITPPISEGAMPGVTRDNIINLAKSSKISFVEAPLTMSCLRSAKAIFLSNSLIGIRRGFLGDDVGAQDLAVERLAKLYENKLEEAYQEGRFDS